jgi:polysaccharide pyruvyl transferase WcaK-like protein
MSFGSKKIGLLDHMGAGNLGDDTTQTAVMNNIKRRWPNVQIYGFSMNPSDTQQRHGIPSYAIRRATWGSNQKTNGAATFKTRARDALRERHNLYAFLKALDAITLKGPRALISELVFLAKSFNIIRTFDILIISGGGQLLDSWGGPWKFPYTIFKWVLLARLAGVKCYFVNVGAGPLQHPLSKFFIARALRIADYVSFRDEKSKTLAREVGFTGEAQVFPDCVYGFDTHHLCNKRIEARDGLVVGLSPMAYCDPARYWIQDQIAYESFVRKLARFGSWLSHRHNLTIFSTDVWFDSQVLIDLNGALKRETDFDQTHLLEQNPIVTTDDLLSRMSSLNYIITCRFHGVVFAHLMNIPVIAISHHPKVTTLMADLGLSKYCLDIDTFDVKLLMDTFTHLAIDGERIKARMAEKLAVYRGALTSQFDQLFSPEAAK